MFQDSETNRRLRSLITRNDSKQNIIQLIHNLNRVFFPTDRIPSLSEDDVLQHRQYIGVYCFVKKFNKGLLPETKQRIFRILFQNWREQHERALCRPRDPRRKPLTPFPSPSTLTQTRNLRHRRANVEESPFIYYTESRNASGHH